jgi:fucose 4-O-acetylase-like acetyltransferase
VVADATAGTFVDTDIRPAYEPRGMGPELDRLVAATPETRDRYMDFLRAASILAVVFGHWFIGILWWQDGLIRSTSAVGLTSGLWIATWFFQVMPIFFFVGGFSNMVSFDAAKRRGDPTWSFVRSRLWRLLRPSLVFLAVWTVVMIGLHISDVGAPEGLRLWGSTRMLRGVLPPGATIPFGPLWFLAVYMVVVTISPLTVRLHRRFRLWVPAAMILGTFAADYAGFVLGRPGLRWFNVGFVLLFPHQVGHFYADGSFVGLPRRVYALMAAVGLTALVLLTNRWVFRPFGDAPFRWFPGIGSYPKSLLGTDVERVSNAYPPTLCFLFAGIWAIGAVMLLRPALSRWLGRPGPWKVTIYVNSIIMTLFLWHMTAYLLAILLLWPLGIGHEHDSTATWWLQRPIWILIPATILVGLVAIFGRFERPRRDRVSGPSPPSPPPRSARYPGG